MTQPAKFIFKNEFHSDGGDQLQRLENEIASLRQALPEAETKGYQTGKNEAEALLATAVNSLAHSAETLLRKLDSERAELEKEAVALALLTARSLAGSLLDAEPAAAVRELAVNCLESLRKSPHIVFRVHPDIVESVEQHLKKMQHERGLEGRLIVLGDPDRQTGDCKIEWADGGFEKRQADITHKIEQAVSSFLTKKYALNSPSQAEKNHDKHD